MFEVAQGIFHHFDDVHPHKAFRVPVSGALAYWHFVSLRRLRLWRLSSAQTDRPMRVHRTCFDLCSRGSAKSQCPTCRSVVDQAACTEEHVSIKASVCHILHRSIALSCGMMCNAAFQNGPAAEDGRVRFNPNLYTNGKARLVYGLSSAALFAELANMAGSFHRFAFPFWAPGRARPGPL